MIPKGFHILKVKYWKKCMKKYMKKKRKMNKERKLKCKQVWGKQIKLNNISWTNTCNNSFTINAIILYTVLRGSALFKGSMQNIVIWETWHKFWCSAIKLHRRFQNKQKLKNNINYKLLLIFFGIYWQYCTNGKNICTITWSQKRVNNQPFWDKKKPICNTSVLFIQHIQLLPNSEK